LFDSVFGVPSPGAFIWAVIRNRGADSVYGYRRV
jgi:hypothetical protein